MYRVTFLIYLLLFGSSKSFTSPIKIRSGITNGQENKGIIYEIHSDIGAKNVRNQEGLDLNNARKLIKAADSSTFEEQSTDNKHKIDQGQFFIDDYKNKDSSSLSDTSVNNNHKKGHHKTGFHNAYHKDESGTNSSFYDDSDDRGGGYVRDTNKGSYGEQGFANNRGIYLDGNRYDQEKRMDGGYDHFGLYDKEYVDNRRRLEEEYRADDKRQGQRSRGNSFGAAGGYYGDRYNLPQPYFEQGYSIPPIHHHEPLPSQHHLFDRYDRLSPYSRSTITVYEDPRYYNHKTIYDPSYYTEENIHHVEPYHHFRDRSINTLRFANNDFY